MHQKVLHMRSMVITDVILSLPSVRNVYFHQGHTAPVPLERNISSKFHSFLGNKLPRSDKHLSNRWKKNKLNHKTFSSASTRLHALSGTCQWDTILGTEYFRCFCVGRGIRWFPESNKAMQEVFPVLVWEPFFFSSVQCEILLNQVATKVTLTRY